MSPTFSRCCSRMEGVVTSISAPTFVRLTVLYNLHIVARGGVPSGITTSKSISLWSPARPVARDPKRMTRRGCTSSTTWSTTSLTTSSTRVIPDGLFECMASNLPTHERAVLRTVAKEERALSVFKCAGTDIADASCNQNATITTPLWHPSH